MKRYAIIVAGGQGLRLGGDTPKQFLLIKGRPVLCYTIEKFQNLVDELILVLPKSHLDYWKELCVKMNFHSSAKLISGGDTRTASVYNGLQALNKPGLVAIHDAVRPFVSIGLIEKLYKEAAKYGNAVPAIAIKESMRHRDTNSNYAVNRDEYVAVQTPQCFDYQTLIDSYLKCGEKQFTDDAGIYENASGNIHLVEGETTNIKITYKEDIAIAEVLLDAIKL